MEVERTNLVASRGEEDQGDYTRLSVWKESQLVVQLALPSTLILIGLTVPTFITASWIGRNLEDSPIYVSAFTLAYTTGNIFCLALLQGLFDASDTFSPQAYGAQNYREVGLVAIRGTVASFAIIIPANVILFLYMEEILASELVGQDPKAAKLAAHFYRIYMWQLPFYTLWTVIWKFLSAQNIMVALVVVISFGCFFVLPLALELFGGRWGFLGVAFAFVVLSAFEFFAMLAYLWWWQPHHPETWVGLSAWDEALAWKPFREYISLGLGGILASLEWVYWEIVTLLIGMIGVVPLAVHTIATQVITVAYMIPLGLGIALTLRLGKTLPRDVKRAQELAWGCSLVSTVVFGASTFLLYIYRSSIFHFFTNDEQVLMGCEDIWKKVCWYTFLLCQFGMIVGIATGLGLQWTLGMVTVIFLWFLGLPAAYYFVIFADGGLSVAWSCIWPPYAFINGVVLVVFVTKDWGEIAGEIRLREGIDDEKETMGAAKDSVDGYKATDDEIALSEIASPGRSRGRGGSLG